MKEIFARRPAHPIVCGRNAEISFIWWESARRWAARGAGYAGRVTDRLDPARLDELWDFADAAASAERFAHEIASAPPVTADELRTQQARALGLAGRGDEADAILAAIDSDDLVVRARVALERGRRLNSSGRPDDAVPYFAAALDLAQEAADDFLAVDALHMLAIADGDRSGEWAARGVALAEASADTRTHRWLIALHNNLGWLHHDAGRYPDALAEFEAADAAARAHGSTEQQQIAHWAIARALRSLGRRDEARAIQQRLLELRPDDEYVVEELEALRD